MNKTAAIFVVCWLLALGLGLFIAHRTPIHGEDGAADLLNLLFGESRAVISNKMYETADVYFHKGVGHDHGDHDHDHDHDHAGHSIADRDHAVAAWDTPARKATEQEIDHDQDDHNDEGDHGHHAEPNDWLSRLGQNLKPHGHEHLSDERQEKELLPWIWMSVKSDPHNVMAYDTGAFFLAARLDKPEEALKLLDDGIDNNPESVDLYFARGEILLHHQHQPREALVAFEKAQKLWQAEYNAWADAPNDSEILQPSSKRNYRLLSYIGHLREQLGQPEKALAAYKNALGFAPTQHTYQITLEKIEKLEAAGAGSPLP